VASKAPNLAKGDSCSANTGLGRITAAVPAKHSEQDAEAGTDDHLLSVYGIAGLTPISACSMSAAKAAKPWWFLRRRLGRLDLGQDPKIKGCHVIGIAGGKDKCHWLTSELGSMPRRLQGRRHLQGAAGGGAEGHRRLFRQCRRRILEACIRADELIAAASPVVARSRNMTACRRPHGPRGVPGLIVVKRLIMQGFYRDGLHGPARRRP